MTESAAERFTKVSDLWRMPWDLLRSSVRILDRLVSESRGLTELSELPISLDAAASFNLAQMLARLYGPSVPDSVSLKRAALEALDNMPELPDEQETFRAIRRGTEEPSAVTKIALPFKVQMLRDCIRARDFNSDFRSALAQFEDHESWIMKLGGEKFSNPNVSRFLRRVTDDLLADFYTKSGYMAMERALECPCDKLVESPEQELDHAEKFLLKAIQRTPGRTSAKMYLAKVYCARAGVFTALAEIAERRVAEIEDRSLGEPDDLKAMSSLKKEIKTRRSESLENRKKSEEIFAQLEGTAEASPFTPLMHKAAREAQPATETQEAKPSAWQEDNVEDAG
jgi:hypothetical protein